MRFEVVRIPVPGLSICNFKAPCKAVNAYRTRIPIRLARFFRRGRLLGASRCRSVLGSDSLITCTVALYRGPRPSSVHRGCCVPISRLARGSRRPHCLEWGCPTGVCPPLALRCAAIAGVHSRPEQHRRSLDDPHDSIHRADEGDQPYLRPNRAEHASPRRTKPGGD